MLFDKRTARFLKLFALIAFACASLFVSTVAHAEPTVIVWHAYSRDGAEAKALSEVVRSFREEHSTIELEVVSIPFSAYASKLEAAIPRGNGPDIFIDAHERVADYVEKSLLSQITKTNVPELDFSPGSVSALTINGVLYGAPLSLKCLALYLREPTWPKGTAPTSLDALRNVKKRPSLAYEASNAYMHAPILHAFGGRMLDENGQYAFSNSQTERSLAWVKSAIADRLIFADASGALITQMFQTGSLSGSVGADAAISGPWLAADLPADLRYHVVPIPPVTEGGPPSRPYLTVEAAFLAKKLREPSHAELFLRHLVHEKSAIVRAKIGRQVVATTRAWLSDELRNDSFLQGFSQAAQTAIPMDTTRAMRAAWEPSTRAIRKVLSTDIAARKALDEAAFRFRDVTRPAPKKQDGTLWILGFGAIAFALVFRQVMQLRDAGFRAELARSWSAYRYVLHAVLVVFLLVVLPLLMGAMTSLMAGQGDTRYFVGLTNYIDILTARGGPLFASGSFYVVLLVTIAWSLVNVFFHVIIGVSLALLLSRPLLRLRALYRVLLIVPWAVPSYVSALAWKGMFHQQLGAVNALLRVFGVEPMNWFAQFSTAFAANIATNVWLGFPFMMVVTLGALTSISKEVLEAASVDGATATQRFFRVTLPLLRPVLGPSVLLGAIWTFNMFNVVFFVSGGEPDGQTDILISDAYRWAFTRQAQFGYASAYAVLIFAILALSSKVLRPRERS